MRKKQTLPSLSLGFLGSLLQEEHTLHLPDEVLERQLMDEWTRIVGTRVVEYARPLHFHQGTLLVRVKNPHWMQELSYLKGRYTQQLNEEFGTHVIRELRFELGELPPLPQAQEPTHPTWLRFELTPDLEREIEEKLAHMPENELKESARRIMRNHYKLTRMRQRHKRPRR